MDPRTDPARIEPTEDARRLRIIWRDGHLTELDPLTLRLACRCAGCIDEFTGQPILDPSRVPQDVHPLEIRHVGRYALGFHWSDGHDTGIYTFEMLREICPCEECRG